MDHDAYENSATWRIEMLISEGLKKGVVYRLYLLTEARSGSVSSHARTSLRRLSAQARQQPHPASYTSALHHDMDER